MKPRALAAPLHRHRNEDEYSFVIEGRIGVDLGGEVVFGNRGDLIFKPRNQWHTFWNAGDEPARILEIISPAGFERYFAELGSWEPPFDPEKVVALAARYDVELDFDSIAHLIKEHGVRFPGGVFRRQKDSNRGDAARLADAAKRSLRDGGLLEIRSVRHSQELG